MDAAIRAPEVGASGDARSSSRIFEKKIISKNNYTDLRSLHLCDEFNSIGIDAYKPFTSRLLGVHCRSSILDEGWHPGCCSFIYARATPHKNHDFHARDRVRDSRCCHRPVLRVPAILRGAHRRHAAAGPGLTAVSGKSAPDAIIRSGISILLIGFLPEGHPMFRGPCFETVRLWIIGAGMILLSTGLLILALSRRARC